MASLAQAQDSLDHFCERVGDARRRAGSTVGELADTEPLLPLPAVPYPAEGTMVRKVAANGLVSVWGNQYSVPPSMIGTEVTVCWRLGDPSFDVVSVSGRLIATHRKTPRGQGRMVRLPEHTAALEKVVLASFTTAGPSRIETEPATIASGTGDRRRRRRQRRTQRPGDRPRRLPDPHRPAEPEPAMSRDSIYQQLRGHLAYLKLAAAAEALPGYLEAARQQDMGHTHFLQALLRVEVEATETRRWNSRMRFANFPTPWQLDDFDFSAQHRSQTLQRTRSGRLSG